ncbi:MULTISPECIES: hypothetical protein [unclassified Streptomyces]|uniref:hypothetical protein n=1 Tax=unclassified Streptomyces TaxID=2593676 RepID=UPI0033FF39B5
MRHEYPEMALSHQFRMVDPGARLDVQCRVRGRSHHFRGNTPQGIALTPDGARAYVVNRGSNTVSVIDTAAGAVTATIGVSAHSRFVAVSRTAPMRMWRTPTLTRWV